MKNLKQLHFCYQCRKPIKKLEESFRVTDSFTPYFCSEECILNFYSPYVMAITEYYDGLLSSSVGSPTKPQLFEQADWSLVTNNPEREYVLKNELNETYYLHIAFDEKINHWLMAICSHVNLQTSFLFYKNVIQDELLLSLIEKEFESMDSDKTTETITEEDNLVPPQEVVDEVEFRKSELLAELMEHRLDHDIDFTEFDKFDFALEDSLDDPDEVYQWEDEEMLTYVKSFSHPDDPSMSFFYIVVLLRLTEKDQEYMIPVLTFPTIDESIYRNFCKGESVEKMLKN